jgi:hypothetical protein
MDAFSYLSVLISIILGLAVTQVLQGLRGLLLARSRLRAYWPSVVWGALLLLLTIGIRTGSALYIEAGLIIALLGFAGTMALAKFLMRGEVIE